LSRPVGSRGAGRLSGAVLRGVAREGLSRHQLPPLAVVQPEAAEAAETSESSLEELVEQARQEGFEAGYRKAKEDERDESLDELRKLRAALDRVVQGILQARLDSVRVAERDVVALAIDLASAVLDRELALSSCPLSEALRRSLELVPDREPIVLRLHPVDASLLRLQEERCRVAPGLLERDVTLIEDESVERHGCVIELENSRIDGQIVTALERARAVLEQLSPLGQEEGTSADRSGDDQK